MNHFLKKENKEIDHKLPTLDYHQNEQIKNDDINTFNIIKPLIYKDWNNINQKKIKLEIKSYIENMARNRLLNPFEQNVKTVLNHFGQAEVNLSVDSQGKFNKSQFLLLTPWYKNQYHLLFSQFGFQYKKERTIAHVGIGQRFDDIHRFLNFGYNLFLDYDLDQRHQRMSIGTEASSDYLKLAANYYFPITKWRDSPDIEDYMERPAKGFDIRLQGYLPGYPQLGGKIKYEQYFGKEVALFNKTKRQKNPKAMSLGINYTPFPLASINIEHKVGENNQRETTVGVTVNYQFGTPLNEQLEPGHVGQARNLKSHRLMPVDRNYNMVMEYKQKQLLSVDLPSIDNHVLEGDTYIMRPLVKSKYPVKTVLWLGDLIPLSLVPTSDANSTEGWQITLPAWNSKKYANNTYRLALKIEDTKGHTAVSNYLDVVVRHNREAILSILGENSALASGTEEESIQLMFKVEDHKGNIIKEKGVTPQWEILNSDGKKIPLVTEAHCPMDPDGIPLPCIRLLNAEQKETGEHLLTWVSSLPGTFQVSGSIKNYAFSNPVTISFHHMMSLPVKSLLLSNTKPTSLPIHGGIFLLEDNPDPGSGAQDYTKPGAPHPEVGKTYLFRAWIDRNNDGIWDKSEPEAMNKITSIQWKLKRDPSSIENMVTKDHKESLSLEEIAIEGATTDKYKIPVNHYSTSIKSHQGFILLVEFE